MSSIFPAEMIAAAETLLAEMRSAGLRIATAESCTGGLVAGLLTEIAGSSDVVERGFVTYSNEAKSECLGVPAELILAHGAVSAEVAQAMAEGALAASRADVAVAVTGVAGPGGGTPEKPVGLVHLCAAGRGGLLEKTALHQKSLESRGAIRLASVAAAIELARSVARDLTAQQAQVVPSAGRAPGP
jgi:nicotinamide-nucleotide amidase